MAKQPDRKIILEDGAAYTGFSFGAAKEKILEIIRSL